MMQKPSLTRRLAEIDKFFPELASLTVASTEQIAQYYQSSSWGYTWVHSRQGAIHMALSDGVIFSKKDYLNQARETLAFIQGQHPGPGRDVLEVGCGRAFNLGFLAQALPDSTFTGVDLTPDNLAFARKKCQGLTNLTLVTDDFHTLHKLNEKTYDVILAVETLCHALDIEQMLQTLYRRLKPGGSLIIYDAYRPTANALTTLMEKALCYTEMAMAVPRFAVLSDFLALSQGCGFNLTLNDDLTYRIQPNLLRLEPYARLFFTNWLIRMLTQNFFPRELVRNAVAGYLMPLTFQPQGHHYRRLIMQKPV